MRCILPIHVQATAEALPVSVILRGGKTPSGVEVRGPLRRLFQRVRRNWPNTRITPRGDSQYGRPKVMVWCEANGVDHVFGLTGNAILDKRVAALATRLADERLRKRRDRSRRHRSFTGAAGIWWRECGVVARLLASEKEVDTHCIAASLSEGDQDHRNDEPRAHRAGIGLPQGGHLPPRRAPPADREAMTTEEEILVRLSLKPNRRPITEKSAMKKGATDRRAIA